MTIQAKSADELLALLDIERARLLARIECVPPAHRAERPGAGQWSAAEIVEHVARVEGGVARMIAKRAGEPLTATPEAIAAAQMTPRKIVAVRVRTTKFDAPERVVPTGTLTAVEAVEQLMAARAALKAAFCEADPAILDGSLAPHPFIGPLTLRAWVELVAHHDARHADQAAECADHWTKER